MKIKWQLSIFFSILFAITGAIAFLYFREQPFLLLAAELLLALLIVVFVFLLRKITRPIAQLTLGIDSLKDQDFSGLMLPTGVAEIDKLVEVYNRMIGNIRRERIFQQEQHFFLQNLVESLPVGLLILDYDDRLKQYNPAAGRILGLTPEHVGKSLEESGSSLAREIVLAGDRTSQVCKADGARYIRVYTDTFRHRGFSSRFIILEEAGEEIMKIERESYGKVIRMMAHEVKNTVGAVNSILETLSGRWGGLPEEETALYLRTVIDRNARMHAFMDNFAKVARLRAPEMAPFDLKAAVGSVFRLMKLREPGKKVVYVLSVPEEPVMIRGSREQMEQALINIILNAAEAAGENGHIGVTLTDSKITVTDNGPGIDPGVKDKLFTPFFSTKPMGQGIGLTMVREILHHHRFPFELYSSGGLTRFEIIFRQPISGNRA